MDCCFFEVGSREQAYFTQQIADLGLPIQAAYFPHPLDASNVTHYADAEAVVVFVHSRLPAEVLQHLPKLRLIVTRSTGYDHIDVAAAHARGITVCHAPGYGTQTVAEYTLALMLALSRRLKPLLENNARMAFHALGLAGIDLMGKTLGVVGTGRIGAHVLHLAHAFGMSLLACDPQPNPELVARYGVRYLKLDDLLPQADIVSLNLPYCPATHHLLDAAKLALLKPNAMLVNTARGGVVDTQALLAVLRQGGLQGGLALDTFEGEEVWLGKAHMQAETLPVEKLRQALLVYQLGQFPQVILSPHNAYHTDDALQRILVMAIQSLQGFLQGQPCHQVPVGGCG